MSPALTLRPARWILSGLVGLGVANWTPSAQAWDPSTTHQGLLEEAAQRSAMHLRWMDHTGRERGLFSPLRVDPSLLDEAELRLLQKVHKYSHADSGAQALGGPGACPGADAPPRTQMFCVQGEMWETSALGWMRLGIIAETTPTARHAHHFLDRRDITSLTWHDAEYPAHQVRHRQWRSNGEPAAGVVASTNFAGKSEPTALAWLADDQDLLSVARLRAHLDAAATSSDQREREHHVAMAMVCTGALLHVVQDLSVPAHARGDASAFFAPLSSVAGDRGLPLQEFARIEYGRRHLPHLPESTQIDGVPVAPDLRSLLLGTESGAATRWEGTARIAARRFLSESSLPEPKRLDSSLDGRRAAEELLADHDALDPIELQGARLTPWPAESGYLRTVTGRVLAAFDKDPAGRTRLYLDRGVYREQAATLLPLAVESSRSVLDLIWMDLGSLDISEDRLSFEVPAHAKRATILVFSEDGNRKRAKVAGQTAEPGEVATVSLPAAGPGYARVVVVRAEAADGLPMLAELRIDAVTTLAGTPDPVETTTPEPDPPTSDPASDPEPTTRASAQADSPAADEPAADDSASPDP